VSSLTIVLYLGWHWVGVYIRGIWWMEESAITCRLSEE